MFWGGLCSLFADTGRRAIAVHHTGTMASEKNFVGVDRLFLGSTAAIIALSPLHAQYIERVDGIPQSRQTIIENGIVTDKYMTPREDAVRLIRESIGISDGDKVVMIVAGLRPEKAHEAVLRAASVLAPSHTHVRFLIVGDGPRRAELEQMAQQLNVADRVHFVGERNDVSDLLHAADIFILPSHPAVETLPLSVMEAMAAGVPVIASAVGSVPDMIEDGVNGRLIPPADGDRLARVIEELLGDPAATKRIAEAGTRTVLERYTLDRMVENYTKLFAGLAE
jgi:glycosyltransferase involved in cell wall biosynthesis